MFGHRVAEIGAFQAPFDNRYSWFQIKSVRDARTKSDPRQCVHLGVAIFIYHRLYQNDSSNSFPSISFAQPPVLSHTGHAIPLSSHCQLHTANNTYTVYSFYIFENTLHYPPYPPTRVGRMYFHRICAVWTTRRVALRNSNVPRNPSLHRRLRNVIRNLILEIDQLEQRSLHSDWPMGSR